MGTYVSCLQEFSSLNTGMSVSWPVAIVCTLLSEYTDVFSYKKRGFHPQLPLMVALQTTYSSLVSSELDVKIYSSL